MKKIVISLLFIIGAISSNAQGTIKPTDIDGFVSVKLPGKVIVQDTIMDGVTFIQKYSINGNAAYFINKVKANKINGQEFNLPYNEKSLYDLYKGGAEGFLSEMKRRNFTILDTSKVQIGNFKGYLLKAKVGKTQAAEMKMIILGEWLYMVMYINVVDCNQEDKNVFLNSVTVKPESPSQFQGKSPGMKLAYHLGKILSSILVLIGIFFLSRKVKKIENNKRLSAQ